MLIPLMAGETTGLKDGLQLALTTSSTMSVLLLLLVANPLRGSGERQQSESSSPDAAGVLWKPRTVLSAGVAGDLNILVVVVDGLAVGWCRVGIMDYNRWTR